MADSLSARFGREFSQGEVLFREGESGNELYVLQSGVVQVTKRVGAEERVIATFTKGEFVGELSVLTGRARTGTATVLEHTKVLVLTGKALEQMVLQSPEIAVRLLRKLARRLDAADEMIKILLNPDPKARVLMGLQRHADRFGENVDSGIRIRITAATLGAELGVTEEQVREVLDRLKRLRIVTDGPAGALHVGDVQGLHEFLEFLEMPKKFEGA